jgi:hypothetical protein
LKNFTVPVRIVIIIIIYNEANVIFNILLMQVISIFLLK